MGDTSEDTGPGRYRDPGRGFRFRIGSGRVGSRGGRPSRTFHCHFRGVQVGRPTAGGGSIDYVAREGDYDDRRDLEHLAGDADELRTALAAVEAAAKVRRGRTAERVAIATTVELPLDSTPEQRRRVADELVALWESRGHRAIAAVHGGDDVQPHVHVLATARPVARTDDGWTVDRDPARAPLRGKAAVRAARAEIAELINEACRPEVRFFGGRDRDLDEPGITGRAPRRRVPERAWHQAGQRDPDPAAVEAARERHRAARQKAQERVAARAAAGGGPRSRIAQRASSAGLEAVPAGAVEAERQRRQAAEDELATRPAPAEVERQIRAAVASALAAEAAKPGPGLASEKAVKAGREMAARLGIELPPGWDESAGTAGATVRVLAVAGRRIEAAARAEVVAAAVTKVAAAAQMSEKDLLQVSLKLAIQRQVAAASQPQAVQRTPPALKKDRPQGQER